MKSSSPKQFEEFCRRVRADIQLARLWRKEGQPEAAKRCLRQAETWIQMALAVVE